jgi:hypothetical protein
MTDPDGPAPIAGFTPVPRHRETEFATLPALTAPTSRAVVDRYYSRDAGQIWHRFSKGNHIVSPLTGPGRNSGAAWTSTAGRANAWVLFQRTDR